MTSYIKKFVIFWSSWGNLGPFFVFWAAPRPKFDFFGKNGIFPLFMTNEVRKSGSPQNLRIDPPYHGALPILSYGKKLFSLPNLRKICIS